MINIRQIVNLESRQFKRFNMGLIRWSWDCHNPTLAALIDILVRTLEYAHDDQLRIQELTDTIIWRLDRVSDHLGSGTNLNSLGELQGLGTDYDVAVTRYESNVRQAIQQMKVLLEFDTDGVVKTSLESCSEEQVSP